MPARGGSKRWRSAGFHRFGRTEAIERLVGLVAIGIVCALAGIDGAAGEARETAAQAPPHRAAVVVDTGTEVKRVCIRFDADAISGREALELAGVEPVFSEFGGALGSLVCSLCGVGCPAGDCLCARDTWWYHRAPAGTSSFSSSSLGASNTLVRDGDVEGWSWGTGAPPAYADLDTVCGLATVHTTTSTATTSAATSSTVLDVSTSTTTTAVLGPSATSTTTASVTTTSTTTATTERDRPSTTTGVAAPATRQRDGESGGSLASLGLAAALVVAILALGRWLRRRRGAATVAS